MKAFITIALLLFCVSAFAQKQNVYYYKNNGTDVFSPDSADYIQVIREPDSGSTLYKVLEYYKNKKPKSIGTSSIIHPVRLEESNLNYYANGKRKTVLNYHKGRLTGKQYYFYPNGRLFQELQYSADNTQDNDYQIITVADTTGAAYVTNGEGYYKKYNDSFSVITEEGPVKKGLKDSIWKGTDEELKITFIEKYNCGNLIEGTSTDTSNIQVKYAGARISPLQYQDGLDMFNRFINKNLRSPEHSNIKQFQVSVRFVVYPNNTLGNFRIIKSGGNEMDKILIKLCNSTSANWTPERKYGRPVPAQFETPTFVITVLTGTRY